MGGVERFAHYLSMALPDLKIYSLQDLPDGTVLPSNEWDQPQVLNQWLLKEKLIDRDTVVIGDGFWVDGLQGKVARLISVVHGAYFGSLLSHECYPWGEPQLGDLALAQERIWRDSDCELVSVSARSADELKQTCGIACDAIIHHGIPLDIYKPLPGYERNKILHVAVSSRKGKEMVDRVTATYHRLPIEQLGYSKTGDMEEECRLWNRGSVLFMPSLFEGSAYGLLEALACGLVPVVFASGYACGLPCEAALVTDDHHENVYIHMLDDVLDHLSSFFPREYAEEYLRFDTFANNWRGYLDIKE